MQQAEAKGTLLNLSFTLWLIDSRVKAIINHWKIGLLDPSTDLDFCPFNERGSFSLPGKSIFMGENISAQNYNIRNPYQFI